MILLFLIIIVGIYGGIFTPTEAGGMGAFGAILISLASRRLNIKILFNSLMEATKNIAMIMLLVVGAITLMKFLAMSKLPFFLAGCNVT